MRSFDIFEVHADGSLFWRVCVSGEYEKDRKLQELKEQSTNQFCALDLAAGETFGISADPAARVSKIQERGQKDSLEERRQQFLRPFPATRPSRREPIRSGCSAGLHRTALMP